MMVLMISCSDELVNNPLQPGYDFFPLTAGFFKVYQVEEVDILGFVPDTSRYFLMEEITDSLISEDGSKKYFLTRSKSIDSVKWTIDSVWTKQIIGQSAIVTENNVPYVKLTFPVEAGKIWNGNAYNTREEQDYTFVSMNSTSIADSTFSSQDLIQVVIADVEKNLVNQDQRTEIYVKGIGLVAKDYTTLNFCTVNCDELGATESGRVLKQELIAYGQH